MKISNSIIVILFFICFQNSFSQTTANDIVPDWDDYFRYGVNPGYYPNWGDKDTILANIAAGNPNVGVEGAGVTAFRATLPEWFINVFGINVRDFAFEHYETLGMSNHTVFLEGPDEFHFDPTEYCEGEHSELFANMYLDIWDNGQNGTPINDENYYALYVYNVVSNYKDYVLYWEIWNEPDFTSSLGSTLAPGEPGSWWTEDPDPCDLAIKAPIEHYVRMLRISYEVIKSIDPDAYVTAGGLGFPSFLHAILRNTDNPVDGSVTPEYPLKGGAYFDVMSYHLYPHLSGCYRIGWNNDIFDFDYQRNSDAAAECIVGYKDDFQEVFNEFGYDGKTYPEKRWIITEINVPRVSTDPNNPNNYGTDEIQRNWVIKACVTAQMIDIDQIYLYQLGETENEANAAFEFNMMGLYKNLNESSPYNQVYTDEGIAYKTLSETLSGLSYDAIKTAAMNLPSTIKGAAFKNDNSEYRYVLWAITDQDQTEDANAIYSFPASFNIESLEKTNWSSSIDGISSNVTSNGIFLTGEPVFLKANLSTGISAQNFESLKFINVYPNPNDGNFFLDFELSIPQNVQIDLRNYLGQSVWRKGFNQKVIQEQINVRDLAKGIYFLSIETEWGSVVRKVVVE